MINPDYIKNLFLFLLGLGLFAIVMLVAMRAIDRIADRDCARGITSACKYVPVD